MLAVLSTFENRSENLQGNSSYVVQFPGPKLDKKCAWLSAEAIALKCSGKKVFLKILQIHRKTPVPKPFF